MKKISIRYLVASMAAAFAVQTHAQVLEQLLSFDLAGIQDGTVFTNKTFVGTPGVGVSITSKDVIGLLVTNAPSDLRRANLLILSDFTGTNGIPTTVVIRGIKGTTNDVDVTSNFTFTTLTNFPTVTTGRVGTNGVSEGYTTYSINRVAVHLGTNAPILSVRGYQVAHVDPAVEWISRVPTTGTSRSWNLSSANGFGPGAVGEIPVFGGVTAFPVSTDVNGQK